MSNAIDRYVDWAWQTAGDYVNAGYRQGSAWIGRNWNWACTQLPHADAFMQRHAYGVFTAGWVFVWNHKKWVLGGAAVAATWAVVNYIRRHTPQYPFVSMKSSLNVARLDISVPEEEKLPINVALHFCIDTSSSMERQRIDTVKEAMNTVLRSALRLINEMPDTQISVSITTFADKGRVLMGTNSLTEATMPEVTNIIRQIGCRGWTDILAGLEQTTAVMTGTKEGSAHTVILLTDGESNIDQNKLQKLQRIFADKAAALFAIGISSEHKKATLEQITTSGLPGFRGTYIDATDVTKVGEAIVGIYDRAIASFSQMELTVPQFLLGKWQVEGLDVVPKDKEAKFQLGALPAGKSRTVFITFNGAAFSSLLDLATVQLQIAFIDPKGRRGTIQLPWNPNTIVDPAILNRRA